MEVGLHTSKCQGLPKDEAQLFIKASGPQSQAGPKCCLATPHSLGFSNNTLVPPIPSIQVTHLCFWLLLRTSPCCPTWQTPAYWSSFRLRPHQRNLLQMLPAFPRGGLPISRVLITPWVTITYLASSCEAYDFQAEISINSNSKA